MRGGLLVFLSGLVACTASGAPSASSDEAITTADSGLSSCDARGPSGAVVLAVSAAARVQVLTRQGGTLVDRGVRVDGIFQPRKIAMRDDGAEIAVGWGNVGGAWGVALIALGPDGSSATLTSTLTLGHGRTAWAIAYAGHDRVVVSAAGPEHELVTLDRVPGTGTLVEKARGPAPGAFTFSLVPTKDPNELLAAHVALATERSTTVERLRADASGFFAPAAAPVLVGPPAAIDLSPTSGATLYAQTYDTSDPVTPAHLEGKSWLHGLTFDPAGVHELGPWHVNRTGSNLAVDPKGRFVVLQGNEFALDPVTHTPLVTGFALSTAPLDGAGSVSGDFVETPPSAGLLFWDMQIASSGHLVVQRVMDPHAYAPAEQNRIETFAQPTAGRWELCSTVLLDGLASLALTP